MLTGTCTPTPSQTLHPPGADAAYRVGGWLGPFVQSPLTRNGLFWAHFSDAMGSFGRFGSPLFETLFLGMGLFLGFCPLLGANKQRESYKTPNGSTKHACCSRHGAIGLCFLHIFSIWAPSFFIVFHSHVRHVGDLFSAARCVDCVCGVVCVCGKSHGV